MKEWFDPSPKEMPLADYAQEARKDACQFRIPNP